MRCGGDGCAQCGRAEGSGGGLVSRPEVAPGDKLGDNSWSMLLNTHFVHQLF